MAWISQKKKRERQKKALKEDIAATMSARDLIERQNHDHEAWKLGIDNAKIQCISIYVIANISGNFCS